MLEKQQAAIQNQNLEQDKLLEYKNNREQQIENSINTIKQRKEEREKKNIEWLKQMKEMKKQKPYFVKVEEEFQQNVILPQIDQEKALINSIRQKMRKPMDKGEFLEHQMKYLEQQKMLELEKMHSKSIKSPVSQTPKNLHQGIYYKKLIEQEEQQKLQNEERLVKLKKIRQKQETYDKFVKECHPAHASPSKQMELMTVLTHLNHPVRQRKSSYDNYLSEISSQLNRSRQGDKTTKSSIQYSNLSSMQNIPDDHAGSKPRHKDYLREIINERQAKSALNSPIGGGGNKFNSSYNQEIQRQLNKKDLTSQQKYELVKFKSQALEKRAQDFEHGFKQQDLTVQSQVNNMYLDSIKAKMALIEQL